LSSSFIPAVLDSTEIEKRSYGVIFVSTQQEGEEDDSLPIVNFTKWRLEATVIQEIRMYQQQMYPFLRVAPIYDYFMSDAFNLAGQDSDMLLLSREIEPRV